MPIINSVITTGGITPSGPNIKKVVDANHKLVNGSSVINLNGATDLGENVLYYAYYGNTDILGALNMSSLTTISGLRGLGYTFYGCTGITSVDLSNLTTISGNSGCNNSFRNSGITSFDLSSLETVSGSSSCSSMFYGCTGITSVNLGSLTTISGSSGCSSMFYNCTGITSVDLSSLTTVSGNSGCSSMFYGCTGITSVDLGSLTTASVDSSFSGMFRGCSNLTSFDLNSLTTVSGSYSCQSMFNACTGITGTLDLSFLITISGNYGCSSMFYNCTGITSADLSSLTTISGSYSCQSMFSGCTSLTSVDFSSLSIISGANATSSMFYNTGMNPDTNIYFPSLKSFGSDSTIKSQLNNMLSGRFWVKLHFPTNMQSAVEALDGYPNFGGTATQCIFDLQETVILLGGDNRRYSRNPKYDTSSSLGWKVGEYGTSDFTSVYYTRGTTLESGFIYLYTDSACTNVYTHVANVIHI